MMSEGTDPFGKAVYAGIAGSQPDQNTYVGGICNEAAPRRRVVAVPAASVDQVGTVVDKYFLAFVAFPIAQAHFSRPRFWPMVTVLDPGPNG